MWSLSFRVFVIFAFIFFSCNLVTQPPPPERENPIDPKNPNFQPPKVEIISGPKEGDILANHTVTFKWRGNQADSLMLFSYRLDYGTWSPWSSQNEVTFTYLDEGKHTFEVKAKYINNIEGQVLSINFTVDAVKGPAFMFFPRKSEVSQGSSFDSEIYIEEGANFAGAKIVIEYQQAVFTLENIEIYNDARSIMLKNGGTLIDFVNTNTAGRVEINVAVAGGSPENVNGTGAIGKVRFRANPGYGGNYEIKFGGESKLRDADNNDIQIKNMVSKVVVIK